MTAIGKTKDDKNRPWEIVLERNFEIVRELYQNPAATNLFLKILEDFVSFSKQHKFHPVFLLMPYLHDMLHIKDRGCYYANFVSQAKEILHTIDLTQPLMSSGNLNNFYSSDFYGGHFTKEGNEFISAIIADELTGFLPPGSKN